MMKIDKNQLDLSKRKKIGRIGSNPVFELVTKGGWHLVVSSGQAGKVLGVGPHRAVARHIALESEPDLLIEELSKSEDLGIELYKHLVPHWTEITKNLNEKL